MSAMLIRRDVSKRLRTSPLTALVRASKRSAIGITTWFETIVDAAMAATITIDVADEKPPRNANSASSLRCSESGRVSTYRSGFDPAGITSRPTSAIGIIKIVMPNR